MTGPDHYREAERVRSAALSQAVANQEGFSSWSVPNLLALAQFHATMALVATQAGEQSTSRWNTALHEGR